MPPRRDEKDENAEKSAPARDGLMEATVQQWCILTAPQRAGTIQYEVKGFVV